MNIKLAELNDVDRYLEHLDRLFPENGKDGLYFSPMTESLTEPKERQTLLLQEKWRTPLDQLGWDRVFLLLDEERVVGALEISRFNLKSSGHRVDLSIGIESAYKSQGFGKKMMKAALHFLREAPGIETIELGVFASNSPALEFYRKFNFEEIGRIPDCFRLDGKSIDDIRLRLAL